MGDIPPQHNTPSFSLRVAPLRWRGLHCVLVYPHRLPRLSELRAILRLCSPAHGTRPGGGEFLERRVVTRGVILRGIVHVIAVVLGCTSTAQFMLPLLQRHNYAGRKQSRYSGARCTHTDPLRWRRSRGEGDAAFCWRGISLRGRGDSARYKELHQHDDRQQQHRWCRAEEMSPHPSNACGVAPPTATSSWLYMPTYSRVICLALADA